MRTKRGTIFPKMIGCLPEEEGAQLRFDFASELVWLEAPWGFAQREEWERGRGSPAPRSPAARSRS